MPFPSTTLLVPALLVTASACMTGDARGGSPLSYDMSGDWQVTHTVTESVGGRWDEPGFTATNNVEVVHNTSTGETTIGPYSGYWTRTGGLLKTEQEVEGVMTSLIIHLDVPSARDRFSGRYEASQEGEMREKGTLLFEASGIDG